MDDVLDCGDRAGSVCRAVHHRRIKLDYTRLVRQTAQANGVIGWIRLDNVDTGNDRVQRVGAGPDRLRGLRGRGQPIAAGDHDRSQVAGAVLATYDRLHEGRGCGGHGCRLDEAASGQFLRHLSSSCDT